MFLVVWANDNIVFIYRLVVSATKAKCVFNWAGKYMLFWYKKRVQLAIWRTITTKSADNERTELKRLKKNEAEWQSCIKWKRRKILQSCSPKSCHIDIKQGERETSHTDKQLITTDKSWWPPLTLCSFFFQDNSISKSRVVAAKAKKQWWWWWLNSHRRSHNHHVVVGFNFCWWRVGDL